MPQVEAPDPTGAFSRTVSNVLILLLTLQPLTDTVTTMEDRKTHKALRTITFSTTPEVIHALETVRHLGYNRSRFIVDAVKSSLKKKGFLKPK